MVIVDANRYPDTAHGAGKSTVHHLVLATVWLTMSLATVVFTEPAPFDFMMIGLVFLLPIVGLTRVTPRLLLLLCTWILIAALGFIAALYATDTSKAAMHTFITFYLSLASITIAGFIARNPGPHARLIASGLVLAAVLAGTAGIIGYMDLIPGTYDLFTSYGRARGAFKDPNVLGAFLTPAIVMVLHMCILAKGIGRACAVAALSILCLALLLSFSRSAWLTTFAAVVIYLYLCILVAPSNRRRMHLMILTGSGVVLAALVLVAALQFSSVSSLLTERASLSQSYDLGPEGRFGGQIKALKLILKSPMGIGALEFRPRYHHEEPHNTWLAMFMNTGWIGGMIYLLLTLGTAVYGFRHVTRSSPEQEWFVVFYAGFLGTLMGGLVVDTDHWRHFFLLIGVVWGFMLAPPSSRFGIPARRTAFLHS